MRHDDLEDMAIQEAVKGRRRTQVLIISALIGFASLALILAMIWMAFGGSR